MKTFAISWRLFLITGFATAAFTLAPHLAYGGATIVIVNGNTAGVGFNDPTPAAPIGGNTGTTLGEQRLIAFQYAASLWGASVDSAVVIRILATMEPLTCSATSAVLGSAGTTEVWRDFPGAPFSATWYCKSLANKLVGVDLDPTTPDIRARFNVNLGNADCLAGSGWYYGLDGNHGSQIDMVTVLLHEFAHGLGFQQFASITTGGLLGGLPDAYNRNILDVSVGKTWDQMTDAERAASAVNYGHVVWKGAEVTTATGCALNFGTPGLMVQSPPSVAGQYSVGTGSFGPALSSPGVTAQLALALTADASPGLACNAIITDVVGKIAVVDRGTCAFTVKVKNAQNAGAVAVIIVNNVAGAPPPGMGGTDATIVIPSVLITQSDGIAIKAAMASGPVMATLGLNLSIRAGTDPSSRMLLYAPNPSQAGSSISHWDTSAFPNQLMEPNINADLSHSVGERQDLTVALMRDIGWFPKWAYSKYDLNSDGSVNLADYNLLMAAVRARSNNLVYDLNCDGKVDIADARYLVLHFSN